jgi:1-acyl-sn-glycerol-3-phosphate acyltransferase
MPKPLRWVLSLLFILQMYLAMLVVAVLFAIPSFISREAAFVGIHAYANWVRISARFMVGLKSEVRGEIPQGDVLVASKHQSFFDVILLCAALPRPRFIMKRELIWMPIFGQYALRIGCIPIDRGKRTAAIAKMKAEAAKGTTKPGQLVIYPQGTRVAPGAKLPFKVGAGLLYDQLGQTCVPVATNVGIFWPKHGIMRQPGVAVIEFLPAIAPGQPVAAFMKELESTIEAASTTLMHQAGWREA